MQKLSFSQEVTLAIYLFSIPFLIHIHVYFPETPVYCLISGVKIFAHIDLTIWAALIYLNIFLLTLLFFQIKSSLIGMASISLLILSASCAIYNIIPVKSKYLELDYLLISSAILLLVALRKKIFDQGNFSGIKGQFSLKNLLCVFLILGYTIFFIWIMFFFPEGTHQAEFLFWTIGDMGFPDTLSFLWYLNNKLGIIIMGLLCFFSTKKWWRYALMSPILLNLYETFGAFKLDQPALDEFEIILALPALVLLAFFLYLLFNSKRMQALAIGLYDHTWKRSEAKLLANNKKEELICTIKTKLEESRVKRTDIGLTDLLDLKHKLEKEVG